MTARALSCCSSLSGEKTGKGHDIFLCKEKTAKLLQSYHIYFGEKKQFLKKDLAFRENLVGYSEKGEYRDFCLSSAQICTAKLREDFLFRQRVLKRRKVIFKEFFSKRKTNQHFCSEPQLKYSSSMLMQISLEICSRERDLECEYLISVEK